MLRDKAIGALVIVVLVVCVGAGKLAASRWLGHDEGVYCPGTSIVRASVSYCPDPPCIHDASC